MAYPQVYINELIIWILISYSFSVQMKLLVTLRPWKTVYTDNFIGHEHFSFCGDFKWVQFLTNNLHYSDYFDFSAISVDKFSSQSVAEVHMPRVKPIRVQLILIVFFFRGGGGGGCSLPLRIKVPVTPKNFFRLIKFTSFPDFFSEKIISIDKILAFLQAFEHVISMFTTAESGIWVGLQVTSLREPS